MSSHVPYTGKKDVLRLRGVSLKKEQCNRWFSYRISDPGMLALSSGKVTLPIGCGWKDSRANQSLSLPSSLFPSFLLLSPQHTPSSLLPSFHLSSLASNTSNSFSASSCVDLSVLSLFLYFLQFSSDECSSNSTFLAFSSFSSPRYSTLSPFSYGLSLPLYSFSTSIFFPILVFFLFLTVFYSLSFCSSGYLLFLVFFLYFTLFFCNPHSYSSSLSSSSSLP